MVEFPRGTVTFLFTDIEGSTRLLKQLGERYGTARADHHRLLRAAYQEHEGQEIDTQGDAFFVAFQRAKDAVAAAAAAQRALAAHDWPGGVPLRVRMGIHTAEPSVSEEGYLGLGVHRAARICSAGHGGQILLSQATVALLEDEVLPGLELRDLGRHQLKDLDRPERIYQLVLPDLPDTFPPLKAELGHATPFEGREGELAEAAAAAVASRWYRTRVGVSTLALVAVAALVAGAALVFTGGSSGLSRIDSDSAGLIDNSNEIKKQVAVGSSPGAIAAGAGAIWVAAGDGISRIDPEANLVTQTISLSRPPSGVAFGGDAVWVVSSEERSLRKISPPATRPGDPIRVGNGAAGVAVGDGAVWVANRLDDTVSKVPTGPGRTRDFPAGLTPSGVAVGKNAVWVSNEAAGTVSRLDPRSGSLTAIPVGNGPTGIAVGSGGVWVANSLDDTVSRIDPDRNRVITIPVGRGPSTVATGADSVWVANRFGGTVSRIDPKTNLVTNTTRVGNSPGGIAFTGDGVWVSARGPLTSHRGGVLRVVGSQGDLDSVDPAAAYNQDGWAIAIMTNDGLLTFKRVAGPDGGQLVPDLAKSIPRPGGDDKTYTFELRQGIHYSNGRLVRASDIRRGLERFFKIHSSADLPPFFQSIEGAPACVRNPKYCELRRGVVTNDDDGTVTFHLSAPDPEFLYQLALPFAAAVPAGTPSRIAKAGSLVPATGPYMVGPRSMLDRRVELVRNPRFHEWSPAAQPNGFPDRIILDYTKQEGAQVTAVERNQADLKPRSIPLERVKELRTRYSERVHVNTGASLIMAFLNVRTPPFDQRSVRRALAYALDHKKTIKAGLGPSQALPTCQILPPNFPGYRPYCPYTLTPSGSGTWIAPNLPKAKELIKSSGTRGMDVKVWAFTEPSGFQPQIRTGRYLKALLNRLGYHASLKIVKAPKSVPAAAYYHSVVGDSRTRAQIGTTGWGADYPAASSFIRPLLSCQAFHPATPGQTNVAEFCDKSIDRKITHALQVQARDPSKAARLWAEIDHDLVDEAPVVPLQNQKTLGFVSKRVGNYQYNPQWGVLLDQLWVR